MLKYLFFALIIRPVTWLLIGTNVRNRNLLPLKGPAVLVANHNSHLDTAVLMTLLSQRLIQKIKPVGARDYFFKNRLSSWFFGKVVGAIPINRKPADDRQHHPLEPISFALQHEDIVIFFPEGTRGEPEQMLQFKSGIARIAEQNPNVPIVPVFMHGLGKSLPKGEAVLIPFFCDVFVAPSLFWNGDKKRFLENLENVFIKLRSQAHLPEWN